MLITILSISLAIAPLIVSAIGLVWLNAIDCNDDPRDR